MTITAQSTGLAGSLSARRVARRSAKLRGGRPAEHLMETYQNELTALAFLHHTVMTSPPPPPERLALQVGDLIVRTQILRPYAAPSEPTGPTVCHGAPGARCSSVTPVTPRIMLASVTCEP